MKRFQLIALRTAVFAGMLMIATAGTVSAQDDTKEKAKKQKQDPSAADYAKRGDYARAVQEYQKAAQANAYNSWLQQYNNQLNQARYQNAYNTYSQLIADPRQESSAYWIGAQCVPAGRVKVLSDIPSIGHLFKEGGLRVNSVTKKSPAAKSGLKKNDVILVFNKAQINQISELTKAIEKAKTSSCTLQVIRQGKVIELSLTPQERPKQDMTKQGRYEWNLPKTKDGTQKYWADFTINENAFWAQISELPEDVEVIMQRKGKNDPIVIVKRGENQWTIRDGKVDELPKELQGYVAGVYRASKNPKLASFTYDPNTVANFNRFYAYDQKQKPKGDETADAIRKLAAQLKKLQQTVDEMKKEK